MRRVVSSKAEYMLHNAPYYFLQHEDSHVTLGVSKAEQSQALLSKLSRSLNDTIAVKMCSKCLGAQIIVFEQM